MYALQHIELPTKKTIGRFIQCRTSAQVCIRFHLLILHCASLYQVLFVFVARIQNDLKPTRRLSNPGS